MTLWVPTALVSALTGIVATGTGAVARAVAAAIDDDRDRATERVRSCPYAGTSDRAVVGLEASLIYQASSGSVHMLSFLLYIYVDFGLVLFLAETSKGGRSNSEERRAMIASWNQARDKPAEQPAAPAQQ